MKTPFLSQARALLVAALLPLVAAAASESPSLLLQKGIYAEEVERNLDSAIKIYEQIAAESAANRTIVAQAQYRLAVCYQKQGKKEQAISSLNELLMQFPSEPLGQKARETLTQLGQAPQQVMNIRQIAVPAGTPLGVTPDRRFLVYQPQARPMDRAIYEIASGKTWTTLKGDSDNIVRGVYGSPDGRRTSYRYAGAIYVVGVDGSDPKQVYRMEKDSRVMPVGPTWLDQRTLICNLWSGKEWTKGTPKFVCRLDINTGIMTRLAELPAHEDDWSWALSRDGRYVALVARLSSDGPTQLWLVDLASGKRETVVEHDVDDFQGWWGTKLVFMRVQYGIRELWMVGAEDGKRVGNPELVRQNLGNADPITITDDGSIYYREQNSAAGTELWMMEGFLAKKPLQNRRLLVGIPLEFVLNGDSAILDRKFNLSATLPARWTIQGAGRDVSGIANVIRFIASDVPESISQFKNYSGQLNYWSGTPGALSTDSPETWTNALGPKPSTSTEVDAWLRNYARLWVEQRNNNQIFTFGYSDYKHRPESIVLRTIGGHRAVTWTADFTRNNPGWTEFITVIYGEKVMARFTAWAPAAKIDALRPGCESLVESIRLP